MKPIITYEEFETHIEDLKSIDEFQTQLDRLTRAYTNSIKESADYIHLPTLFDSNINLLEKLMGDKAGWISFWIYELDFGRSYKKGSVQKVNGESIQLRTTKDLWNKITEDNDHDAD